MIIEQLNENVQIENLENNSQSTINDNTIATSKIQSMITSIEKTRYIEKNGIEMSVETMTV